MQEKCGGIICHGTPGKPAEFNTDFFNAPPGQTVGQTLMARPANYELVPNQTGCPTTAPELLLNPNVPSESLMLKKIYGTHACGQQMPNSTALTLTQEEISCIQDWVYGVIAENGGVMVQPTTMTTGAGTMTTSGSMSSSSASSSSGTTTGTTGAATGSTGAGGSGTTGTVTATTGAVQLLPDFATVKLIIQQNNPSCIGSDCHGGVMERIDFRDEPSLPTTLYQRMTTEISELCGNIPIVSPGDPDNSAIMKVLNGGCGNVYEDCMVGTECIPQMPLGCVEGEDCLRQEYRDLIRQWILDGAPEGP